MIKNIFLFVAGTTALAAMSDDPDIIGLAVVLVLNLIDQFT
jgi:hypothetical protein